MIAFVGFDKKAIGDGFYASAAVRGEAPVDALLRLKEMTPMSDHVTFIRGNERIERLAERPDLAEDAARVRCDIEDADRTYAMGLAALRQAADLPQVELARKPGGRQAAITAGTGTAHAEAAANQEVAACRPSPVTGGS